MLDQDFKQVISKESYVSSNYKNDKSLISQTPEKKKININSMKSSFRTDKKFQRKITEEISEFHDYYCSVSIKSNISHKNKMMKKLETESSKSDKLKEIPCKELIILVEKRRNTITYYINQKKRRFPIIIKSKYLMKKKLSKSKFNVNIDENNLISVLDIYGNKLIKDISHNMNIQNKIITCKKENLKEIILSRKNSDSPSCAIKLNKSKIKPTIFIKSFNLSSMNIDGTIEKEGRHSERSKETMLYDTMTLLSECKFLIFHENNGKKLCDFIILVMVLYNMFITPMYLTFYPNSSTLTIIEIIIEVTFILEMISNFFTTYRDEEDNIISSLIQISLNYLFTWFIYDLITSIPYIYLFDSYLIRNIDIILSDQCIINITIINWIKMLRIVKIFRDNTGKFLTDLVLNNNYTLNRILKFLLGFCFLIHISTCFFVFLGLNTVDNLNWINKNQIDRNIIDLYIASLYYNLVTIYSIGYGDITPVNIIERIWVNVLLMIGSMLYSYAISSLSTIFLEESNKYGEYKRKQKVLDSIYEEYDLPVTFYYELKQTLSHAYQKNENERYQFVDSLPSKIKNDLIILMYRETVGKNIFFQEKSNDFILYVLPLIKFHQVNKGDILISEENFVEEMYFVLNGSLSLNMGVNYQRIEIWEIKKNQYFGDLLMKLDEHSPYELTCRRTRTEVFVLKKEEYLKIKNSFSQVIFDILEESFKLYEQIDKKRQLFLYMNQFYSDPNEAMIKMTQLNTFLFDTGFNDFFYMNDDFIDPNEFISTCDDQFINILLQYFDNNTNSKSIIIQHLQNFKKPLTHKPHYDHLHSKPTDSIIKNNFDIYSTNNDLKQSNLSLKKYHDIIQCDYSKTNEESFKKKLDEGYKNKRNKMKESFKIYKNQISKNLNFSSEYDNLQREENLKNKTEHLFSSDRLMKSSTKVKGNSKKSLRYSHLSEKGDKENKKRLFTSSMIYNLNKQISNNFQMKSKIINNSFNNLEICLIESFSIINGRFLQEEIIRLKQSIINKNQENNSIRNKISLLTTPDRQLPSNQIITKNVSSFNDFSDPISKAVLISNKKREVDKQLINYDKYSLNKLNKIFDFLKNLSFKNVSKFEVNPQVLNND